MARNTFNLTSYKKTISGLNTNQLRAELRTMDALHNKAYEIYNRIYARCKNLKDEKLIRAYKPTLDSAKSQFDKYTAICEAIQAEFRKRGY